MQQKVRARPPCPCSRRPVLLLLDEPTTGLDPRSKARRYRGSSRENPAAKTTPRSCCAPTTMHEAEGARRPRRAAPTAGELLFPRAGSRAGEGHGYGVEEPSRRRSFVGDRPVPTRDERTDEDREGGRCSRNGVLFDTGPDAARGDPPRGDRPCTGVVRAERLPRSSAYILWDIGVPCSGRFANTLTIVFIARGVGLAPGRPATSLETKPARRRRDLGVPSGSSSRSSPRTGRVGGAGKGRSNTPSMAPVSRPVHLIGMGMFAVLYGFVRAAAVFPGGRAVPSGIHVPHANYGWPAVALLAIASVSFIGVGMMTAVLPLISPEKGTQLGFVAPGP